MNTICKKQDRFIAFLSVSKSITEACKRARIGRSTYYLWLQDSDFKEKLTAEMNQLAFEARQTAKAAAGRAVAVLISLMDALDNATKHKAAVALLEYNKANQADELEERLSTLERLAKGWRHG